MNEVKLVRRTSTQTYRLSLKSRKRASSELCHREDKMSKRRQTSSDISEFFDQSPSKRQTLITNFYESPPKKRGSSQTPVKSSAREETSRPVIPRLNLNNSDTENEVIIIHDSQSQGSDISSLNVSNNSKKNADVIVIDDSYSLNDSLNRSNANLSNCLTHLTCSQKKTSIPLTDFSGSLNINHNSNVLYPSQNLTGGEKISLNISKETCLIRLKRPEDLLSDTALSSKIPQNPTIPKKSPKKRTPNRKQTSKVLQTSPVISNKTTPNKTSKRTPRKAGSLTPKKNLMSDFMGATFSSKIIHMDTKDLTNKEQIKGSSRLSCNHDYRQVLDTMSKGLNKSIASQSKSEVNKSPNKPTPLKEFPQTHSNVVSDVNPCLQHNMPSSLEKIICAKVSSEVSLIRVRRSEELQSESPSALKPAQTLVQKACSPVKKTSSPLKKKLDNSSPLKIPKKSLSLSKKSASRKSKEAASLTPEKNPSENDFSSRPMPKTPLKSPGPINGKTPVKSPSNRSPLTISTPKKNLMADFTNAQFSPKIQRGPNKYFSKGSVPEQLGGSSPAKVGSPKKSGSPRKRKPAKEIAPVAGQSSLKSFLGSDNSCESNLLNEDMDCFKDETWKVALNLINDREAMEKIRMESASVATSPSKRRRNLIAEDSVDIIVSYLLTNPMISCAKERGLLGTDEEFGSMIKDLSDLKPQCQRLYAKLFERTPTWYRVEADLVKRYSDIYGDVRGLVQTLVQLEFVTDDLKGEDLLVLLKLLQVGELKSVCKYFNVKLTDGTSMNKDNMIQALLNHALTQRTLFGNLTEKIKQRVIKELGQCVKLSNAYNQMFNLLVIIATYPYYQDEEKKRLGELVQRLNNLKSNRMAFPTYAFRPDLAFADFKHLASYAEALTFVAEYNGFVEAKNWDSASQCILEAKTFFHQHVTGPDTLDLYSRLGGHLMKFTAGYQYCYCLSSGISVLKKNARWEDECLLVIQLLLSQSIFCQKKRGIWYDELALLHQSKKKDLVAACEAVIAGLEDPKVDIIRKKSLSQRGVALLKRKTTTISSELRQKLGSLLLAPTFTPSTTTITALSQEGEAGRKQVFYRMYENRIEYSSVEEIAIEHYKNQATPSYMEGIHDEGRTLMNIILACFYDVIYSHPEGDSMFHCLMQTVPLDWGGTHFYKRRKDLIEDVLERFRLGGVAEIMSHLQILLSLAEDTTSVVNWDYIRSEKHRKIKELLECLGSEVFLRIAEHIIKDYKTYHSGFPDLILWDPPTSRCLLVEVKGPNDKLSPSQTVWLENLTNFGANAIVCHVENLGSRKRKVS